MKTYVALAGNKAIASGGWQECLQASSIAVTSDPNCVVKILALRPDDKRAKVVREVTIEGFRHIYRGRTVPVKRLMRLNHG
jgi:hypothetical protein